MPRAVAALGHASTTWDRELRSGGRQLFGSDFLGVFSNDDQPRGQFPRGKCWIYNRSFSYEPGTHWQAAYSIGGEIIRWDSFGRVGRLHPETFVGSNDREQESNERWCGQLSIAWLLLARDAGWKNAAQI